MIKHRGHLHAIFLLTIACTLTGCPNLSAVRTFADETKKVTVAFEPMLKGSASSCEAKLIRKKLITSRTFDPAVAEQKAEDICGRIEIDNKRIEKLNVLLEQYADTLTALADDKVPTYKTELNGLKDSLGKIKKTGSTDPLIADSKLTAIASLADLLSKVVTQQMQKNAIHSLLDHGEAIGAIADALKSYALLNYQGWLKDEKGELEALNKNLGKEPGPEPLAAHYLMTILYADGKLIDGRIMAVNQFAKSIDELKNSHKELLTHFYSLDSKSLAEQLAKFSQEVSDLKKQIRDSF